MPTTDRPAMPVEAVHLVGCEHSTAPTWLCSCPRPIYREPNPRLVALERLARDSGQTFIADELVAIINEADHAD